MEVHTDEFTVCQHCNYGNQLHQMVERALLRAMRGAVLVIVPESAAYQSISRK